MQELFNITKEKLEETEQNLEETTNKLVDTKKNLVKTRVDRDEQQYLVSQHIKSEAKLHSQATQVSSTWSFVLAKKKKNQCRKRTFATCLFQQLLGTVDLATNDVEGLHAKLDRKKNVEAKNKSAQEQFRFEKSSAGSLCEER